MTKEQKLIELGKLDGFEIINEPCLDYPNYLTNGDEIRRLIGKQTPKIIEQVAEQIWGIVDDEGCDIYHILLATPEQLADALLKATGNWVD